MTNRQPATGMLDRVRRADLGLFLPTGSRVAHWQQRNDPIASVARALGNEVVALVEHAAGANGPFDAVIDLEAARSGLDARLRTSSQLLRPGGVLILVFDRAPLASMITRHQNAGAEPRPLRQLRRHGLDLASHHLIAPSSARPRLVVRAPPASRSRSMIAETCRIGAEEVGGRRALVLATAARLAPLTPRTAFNLVNGHLLVARTPGSHAKLSALEQISEERPSVLQVGWGGVEGDRTIHRWSNRGWDHVSMPRTPNWDPNELLATVASAASTPGWRVPRHRVGPSIGEYRSVIVDHLDGNQPTAADVPRLASALADLHLHGAGVDAPLAAITLGRLGSADSAVLRAESVAPDLVARVKSPGSILLPSGLVHGDAVPRNCRVGDGWVGAFDWDSASRSGLPALDLAALIARSDAHPNAVLATYERRAQRRMSQHELLVSLCALSLTLSPERWSAARQRIEGLLPLLPALPIRS